MAFKTMEWIRKVRDEDYRQCKKMSPEEKIAHTRGMAKRLTKKKTAGAAKENPSARATRP